MRQCPECGRKLAESAFGQNKSQPDGLSFYCLACNRARNNRWYREHRRRQGQRVRDHSWIPEGFRWCPDCKTAVAHQDYTRNSRGPSGYGSRCKACHNASNSEAYWKRTYGLTKIDVAQLRTAQKDRCAICGDPGPQHLDHDHGRGGIRQLLCQRCNHGLGLFRDDPGLLHLAAFYVQGHRERQALAALQDAAGNVPEGAERPADPPVGSQRRPGTRGTSSRRRGTSRPRRQAQAGEADT
jgi:hypothetical protein